MGHEKFEITEVYTKLFALDVATIQQFRISLDTQDALRLLRGRNEYRVIVAIPEKAASLSTGAVYR